MRDKPLMTYLIVNMCLVLGRPAGIDEQFFLSPSAMSILAFHSPCEGSGCANVEVAISIDYLMRPIAA